ncbi:hypothetical protein LTR97_000529 [Elasticomyces elasticus]|uniref:Uncharacterized protein n=1 Tax=Elasticomyces elasticus TaxID=574655 RepID=A0AAN8A5K0_9PEZI|nr:hypothetical protein LTR97_000529 [Elasticomyces elasticus]
MTTKPTSSPLEALSLEQPCYLLRLPAELRVAIYELVVRYDEQIDIISLPRPADCIQCSAGVECIYPPLTRVGGLISSEAIASSETYYSNLDGKSWSGICGLKRAFERIGAQHCDVLQDLELHWECTTLGEASLNAMTAWMALWVDSAPYLPKDSAITRIYPSTTRQATSDAWPPPPPPPHLPFLSFSSSSRPWSDPCSEALRMQLREALITLARQFHSSISNVAARTSEKHKGTIKEHIVAWISENGEQGLEQLKHFIRRCWQMKSRYGTFMRQDAHNVLDAQKQGLVPLFRLTLELRLKIYALILELPTDSPAPPPWHSTIQGRSSRRPDWKDMQIRLENLDVASYGDYWYRPTENGIPSLFETLPPLLRLNHQVSAEALAPYLRFTRFTTSLEFRKHDVCSLTAFATQVRALQCQLPVELEIEWLWPVQPSVQTLVAYANLFAPNQSGSNAIEAQLHISHKPARTTLMRLLADLLVVLQDLGNTEDSHMASLDHRKVGYEFGEVCEICRSCMLDWMLQDEGPDGCQEVKKFCRDIFRLDINAHIFPETIPFHLAPGSSPTQARPDPFTDQVTEHRGDEHEAHIQDQLSDAEEATHIDASSTTLGTNHEQASTEPIPVADIGRAFVVRPGAIRNMDQAIDSVPPVDGPADVPDLLADSAIFAVPLRPGGPLKHPEWFDMGCAYPFEEGKGKSRKR